MSSDPRTPMTEAEVDDLLKATLHGPLPFATQMRMMATLAKWCHDRKAAAAMTDTAIDTLLRRTYRSSDPDIWALHIAVHALTVRLAAMRRPVEEKPHP